MFSMCGSEVLLRFIDEVCHESAEIPRGNSTNFPDLNIMLNRISHAEVDARQWIQVFFWAHGNNLDWLLEHLTFAILPWRRFAAGVDNRVLALI